MGRFLLSRVLQALGVVFGVLVLTFVIARLVPGDPAIAYAGPKATAAEIQAARVQFGLDQSAPHQFVTYVLGVLRGDWGTSLHTKAPVLDDLFRVVPTTLVLVISALVLAVAVGIPLGMFAARAHGRIGDLLVARGLATDDEVRAARARDQARLGLDLVRVLHRRGGDADVGQVAREFVHEGTPLGLAGKHLERRVRRGCGRQQEGEGEDGKELAHGSLQESQKLWAPCAPRLIWYWMKSCLSASPSRERSCASCRRRRENSLGLKSTITVFLLGW